MLAFQLLGMVLPSIATFAFAGDDFYNIVSSSNIISSENIEIHTFSADGAGFNITETKSGVGQCPFDPRQNSTHVYVNGELYSGTAVDFQGITRVISKNRLTTRAAVYEQLNDPSFVHSFTYGDFVYFVFREIAIESLNCGKRVYSRIARVCKNDRGDKKTQTKWTSFLKSRLNCSVPGEYPFYFDEVQSVTNVITGIYGGQIRDIIYAVFTTPPNSVSGSAVCAFSIRSIQDTFDGDFKEQETQKSNWLPMPKNKIPKSRRPGTCVPKDEALPDDEFVGFIQSHTLMDAAVPGFFNRPFVNTLGYHFTKITVDPQVQLQDGRTIDNIDSKSNSKNTVDSDDIDSKSNSKNTVDKTYYWQRNVTIVKIVYMDSQPPFLRIEKKIKDDSIKTVNGLVLYAKATDILIRKHVAISKAIKALADEHEPHAGTPQCYYTFKEHCSNVKDNYGGFEPFMNTILPLLK
ncbi:semaphorin-1A-like [Penaeus monodon]|uniref:semaphorin-1A-like n=1 Tax=Penaeus monodon TaxID=6687 RepID=UPI0018A6E793|nr:semaphorin-1A-like [Penaeus monodon]